MSCTNTLGYEDFDKICRVCLFPAKNLGPLFGSSLDNMLSSIGQVEIIEGDGLPSSVCKRCTMQISSAHSLKVLCNNSHKKLMSILQQQKKKENCLYLKENYEHLLPRDDESSRIQTLDCFEYIAHHSDVIIQDKPIMCIEEVNDENNGLTRDSIMVQNMEVKHLGYSQNVNCYDVFENKSEIRIHKLNHPIKVICQVCKMSISKRSMSRHMKIQHGNSYFRCHKCSKKFKDPSNFDKHIESHSGVTKSISIKRFLCNFCGRKFKWHSSLSKHLRIHLDKVYKCEICLKSYAEASSLKIHQRNHTGERPYICGTCNRGFTQKSNLSKHQIVHSQDKRYPCRECNRKYSHKSSLLIHAKVHKKPMN